MKKQMKSGITLIALVITIIILLILAAITINLTIGQRGILNMAQEAGRNYVKSAEEEDKQLSNLLGEIDKLGGEETPDPTPEEYFDFNPETGGIAIKDMMGYYNGNSKKIGLKTIIIPSIYNGNIVKEIGIWKNEFGYTTFAKIEDVERIIIPNTVTTIHRKAFYGCELLTSVIIPNSVIEIATDSFDKCINLNEINVDKDNTVYASYDGILMNKEKTEIIKFPIGKKVYNIPREVTGEIGADRFNDSTSLNEINVDENNMVYASCDGILMNKEKTVIIKCPLGRKVYNIPSDIEMIAYKAFYNCNKLTSITIPSSVTYIGYQAFGKCTSLKYLYIPESVNLENIGEWAITGAENQVIEFEVDTKPDWWTVEDDEGLNEMGVTVRWGVKK